MRALLVTDGAPTVVEDYPAPRPGVGEALIRMRMAGICATDLHLLSGYKGGYRGVLGHEFVGEVVAAPAHDEWVGRRVVGELNVGCGQCQLCVSGSHRHCQRRKALGIMNMDGVFAEYFVLPVANLHAVPDQVPDKHAVFTEPCAAAVRVLEQLPDIEGQQVIVVGDGRLGLLVAQVIAFTGCDLTVIGRNVAKLEILADLGIHCLTTSQEDDLAALKGRADVVVEATGSFAGFSDALEFVRPLGTLILKSTPAGGLPDTNLSSIVVNEITVLGSRCGPFPPALDLLRQRHIQVDSLIHAVYKLEDALEALEVAGRKGILKVLIVP